jgi:hypothetical protein
MGTFFIKAFGIGFLLIHKPFFDIKFLYFYYSRFYKKVVASRAIIPPCLNEKLIAK